MPTPPTVPAARSIALGLARSAVVAVLAVLVAPLTVPAQEATRVERESPARTDSTARALADRLPELTEGAEIPGLSAALVRDGDVVWTGAFGVRSVETAESVNDTTVFEAASLSKPVFAYAVMRLVERGVMDLDRPLAEVRPNPRLEHEPRHRRITARMVLSHSTGLPNWGGDRLELSFEPGTEFSYSGEGYVWLQQAVEELTGLGLQELMQREVFGPLGMERSSYVWQPRFEGNAVVGHGALNRPDEPRRGQEANAAASLLTTAGDYGRFVAAVLSGRGLSPATRREMLTPVLRAEVDFASQDENARIAWALGWGIQDAHPVSYWHWGDNGNHKAFVAAYPDRGTGVVYFANSTHGLAVAEEVARIVSGGKHWGPGWAGYERHDAPARTARRRLLRTFRASGEAAGLERLRALRSSSPQLFSVQLASDLAALLHQAELDGAAAAVLETAAGAFPDSASVREELAELYLSRGRFEEALRTLEDLAAAAEGESADGYRRQVAWVEARLAVERRPLRLPPERLRAFAGSYGPRQVTLEDGELHYRREGNRRFRLRAVGPDTFGLVGLETFRLRFVTDGEGTAEKVVGLYYDGRRDENARDGS